MPYRTRIAAAIIALFSAGVATAAPPKVVAGPNSDPQCFAPWASDTKLFQYPAKKGPYRIALANGYIANTWRIQMIKTAKAYAASRRSRPSSRSSRSSPPVKTSRRRSRRSTTSSIRATTRSS